MPSGTRTSGSVTTSLVVGGGPIGVLVAAVARRAGAARVFVSEPLEHRRRTALRFGADAAWSPEAVEDELMAATSGRGVDVVVEMAGADEGIATAVACARPGARVALGGIPSTPLTAFPAAPARRKGLTFAMVRRMHETYPRRSSCHVRHRPRRPRQRPLPPRELRRRVRARGAPHRRQDGHHGVASRSSTHAVNRGHVAMSCARQRRACERHLARARHLLHPAVEVGHVRLEHLVPVRGATVEEDADLLERHPGRLAADDDRDPHHVVLGRTPPPGAVPRRLQQPDRLPVAEHVGLEAEPGGHLARPTRMTLGVDFMST